MAKVASWAPGRFFGTGSTRVRLVGLSACGLAMEGLLLAFIVLYTNFPSGHSFIYGISLRASELSRSLWPYPILEFSPGQFSWWALSVIAGLWVAYGWAYLLVPKHLAGSAPRGFLVALVIGHAVFSVTLAAALPSVLASDAFTYTIYGRMVSVYGVNPYTTAGFAVGADIVTPYLRWGNETSRYGPVWVLVSTLITLLAPASAMANVLAFKMSAALFSAMNCLLIYVLAKHLGGSGVRALALYAWNPLILIETAGSGHNEALMTTLVLGAILLAVRNRWYLSSSALALAVSIKYLPATLAFFLAARVVAAKGSLKSATRLLLTLVGIGMAVICVVYLPFVIAGADCQQLLSGLNPGMTSLRNPLWIAQASLVFALTKDGRDVAEAAAAAEAILTAAGQTCFAVVLLTSAVLAGIRRWSWDRVVGTWGLLALGYTVLVYGGMYPWYLIPPLAIAYVVRPSRIRWWLLGSSTALAVVFTLVYGLPLPMRPVS